MKMKYRIKEAMQFLSFVFYPRTTLIACVMTLGSDPNVVNLAST